MAMMDAGGGPPAQQSPEQAQYRTGNPIKHCGICTHYKGGACEVVVGDINPYMVSNEFNPWRPNPLHAKGIHFYLKGTDVWRKNREKRRQETGKGSRGKAKGEGAGDNGKTVIGRKEYD